MTSFTKDPLDFFINCLVFIISHLSNEMTFSSTQLSTDVLLVDDGWNVQVTGSYRCYSREAKLWQELEPVLTNFVSTRFPILVVKLECLRHMTTIVDLYYVNGLA